MNFSKPKAVLSTNNDTLDKKPGSAALLPSVASPILSAADVVVCEVNNLTDVDLQVEELI